jgi:hypothetical protein
VETTQTEKKPLLCVDSQKVIHQHIGRLFRELGENKELQTTYNKGTSKIIFGVCYNTMRCIYNREYVAKRSIEKVLRGFGLKYDLDLWLSDGVIKILGNGEK